MNQLQRTRIVWAAIVAFLPLYGIVGWVLIERNGPPERTASGGFMLATGIVMWVVALAARPVLHRMGVPAYPAYLFAWSAAEAVAIVGLVSWIESGDARAFAVAAALSLALLVVLFPREDAPMENPQ